MPTPEIELELGINLGEPVVGAGITVSGQGLKPGSTAHVVVRSTPIEIGTPTVRNDGTFSGRYTLPKSLDEGQHSIIVEGTGHDGRPVSSSTAFTVGEDGVLEAIEDLSALPAASPGSVNGGGTGPAAFPRYDVAEHAPQVIEVTVAGMTVLAVAGAASGMGGLGGAGGSGTSGGGKGQSERRKGKVSSLSVTSYGGEFAGQRWGDASRTWRWRWTPIVDRWSASVPLTVANRSALLSHVAADATYLRAMLGAFWGVLPVVGAVLGLAAVLDTNGDALPPAWGLLVAIVILGILDSAAGLIAMAVFGIGVILGGGIDSADAFRGFLGVCVLGFGAIVVASYERPLRREPSSDLAGAYQRWGDVVIASLIAAYAAKGMLGALPGLFGLDLPIAERGNELALIVLLAAASRVGLETLAANLYPERLERVSAGALPKPPRPLAFTYVCISAVVFTFVAVAFVGHRWELYAGAALFLIAKGLKVYAKSLPNSEAIFRWFPRGWPNLVLVFAASKLWGDFMVGLIDEPQRLIPLGFVALGLPGFADSLLRMFGREGPDMEPTWPRRAGGVALTTFVVLYAQEWWVFS